MTKIPFLLLSSFFLQTGFSQPTNQQQYSPFEYKWLNQQFPIDTLISYNFDTLILSQNEQYYVINFWFTTCPPCIAEIKWLNKLKEEFQNSELDFIAVSFEKQKNLNNFLENHSFEYKQFYLEQKKINEMALTIGYPTTIIIDKNQKVIFQKSGGHDNEKDAVEIYQLISKEFKKLNID